eukprot:7670626-Ditylum_brightwellii.AAC.1
MLRQAVGRGSEIGSSMWRTSSFNHDTEQWELDWPEEKTGTANLMTFQETIQTMRLTMLLEGKYSPDDQ